ncbi:bifunctional phosphoribosyl-AMP cyclohydrolase/phosphoribosyl-ATP diphosphatase HisIE [Bacillaceae bacterium S4-13-58]
MNQKWIEEVRFDEKGLVPAIVQDSASKEVLTLAYMNKESLTKTIETGQTWFFSRSRQELWHKGETSGNTQTVQSIKYDCDQDAVLVLVDPAGPACHTGSYSCFDKTVYGNETVAIEDRYAIINELESLLAKRKQELPEGSYTASLFKGGVDRIGKKVIEEAGEVVIAAKNHDQEEMAWEAADLLFHTLLLMTEEKLSIDRVLQVLEERHQSK